MKTILIDCLVLNGSHSGYRRIISNLLYTICEKKKSRFKYIFLFQRAGFESIDIDFSKSPDCTFIVVPSFHSKWVRGAFEQIFVPIIAAFKRVDLIFMPCTFGLAFPTRPTLTFVHTNTSFAIGAEMRGRDSLQQFVHNFLIRMTSRTSVALVFTTSQTMREFMTYTRCDSQIGSIIGNGVLLKEYPPSPWWELQPLFKFRYVLSVSQVYRLKNFDTLIRAFIQTKANSPSLNDLRLAIVGTVQEISYYAELRELAANRNDILFFNHLSDAELDTLYRNATLYCQMSYFEGYSLTPAEALLHGVPTLVSEIPTHREVYGDLVQYADPHNYIEVATQLSFMLQQPSMLNFPAKSLVAQNFGFESFHARLEDAFNNAILRSINKAKIQN